MDNSTAVSLVTMFDATDGTNFTTISQTTECSVEVKMSMSSKITQISTQVIMAIIMLGFGCSAELKLMWKYIKQPKQFIVGLVFQLLFFPLWALALSKIFVMSEAETMGAIILAATPGGIYSNIISYWVDGDMDLSIVLTTASTILAMGTLPLWLFVLPKIANIQNDCLNVPFASLGYTILGMFLPVIVGVLIRHKYKKAAQIINKICAILGSLALAAVIIFTLVVQGKFFITGIYWKPIVFCIIFPLTALACGYLAARVPWLTFSVAARRTIAIETVMQNSSITFTILIVSYDVRTPTFGATVVIPFIYAMIQVAGLFFILPYLLLKWSGRCSCLYPTTKDASCDDTKQQGVPNKAYSNETV